MPTTRHEPIQGPMPLTKKWYELRGYDPSRDVPVTFGASDAGALLCVSHYKQPRDVYEAKLNPTPIEDTNAMRLGRKMEPVVLSEYQLAMDLHDDDMAAPQPMFHHPEYPFITATPDAIARFDDDHLRTVDAKTTTTYMIREDDESGSYYGSPESNQIPYDYYCQLQQQMLVLGLDYADLAVLVLDRRETLVYHVDCDEELIELLIANAQDMYRRVLEHNPPDIIEGHSSTSSLVTRVYHPKPKTGRYLSNKEAEEWRRYLGIQEQIKTMKAAADKIRSQLQLAMEDLEIGLLGDDETCLKQMIIPDTLYQASDLDGLDLYATIKDSASRRNDPGDIFDLYDDVQAALALYEKKHLSKIGTVKRRGNRQLRTVKVPKNVTIKENDK